uniref:Uncharacterized protein n=1 Tax=Anguilla anguilla TaxID=7936 RepID=A0A0E9XYV1_ANGAN
MQELILLQSWM